MLVLVMLMLPPTLVLETMFLELVELVDFLLVLVLLV
jgi:hypothetical protein